MPKKRKKEKTSMLLESKFLWNFLRDFILFVLLISFLFF